MIQIFKEGACDNHHKRKAFSTLEEVRDHWRKGKCPVFVCGTLYRKGDIVVFPEDGASLVDV